MSRIQQILDKAEREGRMRRTVSIDDPPPAVVPAPPAARALAAAPARRTPPAPLSATASPPAVANPVVAPARTADARIAPLGVAALEPHSPVAEQYRAVRTRIAQLEHDRYYRAILVTSPSAGDGKSVTSLNLALAMAQEFHRRVLLVDADLRDPSLHRLLGLPGRPGLSDVLSGAVPLDDALVTVAGCRLTFLPAGSPVDRAAEILGSAEMRRLVDALRTQFDRMIFDTPPASPLADVGALAPLADGVLMVVRAGRTPRPAIDRAIEDVDSARIIGLVLNDVEESDSVYSYGGNAVRPSGAAEARPGRSRRVSAEAKG
jgi:non-specific protein-tyrosine kinase